MPTVEHTHAHHTSVRNAVVEDAKAIVRLTCGAHSGLQDALTRLDLLKEPIEHTKQAHR